MYVAQLQTYKRQEKGSGQTKAKLNIFGLCATHNNCDVGMISSSTQEDRWV